jgi:hypothetical protein
LIQVRGHPQDERADSNQRYASDEPLRRADAQ